MNERMNIITQTLRLLNVSFCGHTEIPSEKIFIILEEKRVNDCQMFAFATGDVLQRTYIVCVIS